MEQNSNNPLPSVDMDELLGLVQAWMEETETLAREILGASLLEFYPVTLTHASAIEEKACMAAELVERIRGRLPITTPSEPSDEPGC